MRGEATQENLSSPNRFLSPVRIPGWEAAKPRWGPVPAPSMALADSCPEPQFPQQQRVKGVGRSNWHRWSALNSVWHMVNAHQSGTIITIFLLTTIMSLSDTFISTFGVIVCKFQTTSNIWLLYDSGEVTGPQWAYFLISKIGLIIIIMIIILFRKQLG